MEKQLLDKSCKDFLTDLASKAPTPGGGGGAALAGAIAAALTSMVANLTLGKEKFAQVVVPDDQLSLAIGKSGQNARLAARLTNWKIDIKSETQFREMIIKSQESDKKETEEETETE